MLTKVNNDTLHSRSYICIVSPTPAGNLSDIGQVQSTC